MDRKAAEPTTAWRGASIDCTSLCLGFAPSAYLILIVTDGAGAGYPRSTSSRIDGVRRIARSSANVLAA